MLNFLSVFMWYTQARDIQRWYSDILKLITVSKTLLSLFFLIQMKAKANEDKKGQSLELT